MEGGVEGLYDSSSKEGTRSLGIMLRGVIMIAGGKNSCRLDDSGRGKLCSRNFSTGLRLMLKVGLDLLDL